MKRVLALCCAMAVMCVAMAQSSSRESLKKVLYAVGEMQTYTEFNEDSLGDIVSEVVSMEPSLSADTVHARLSRYIKSKVYDDVAEILLPYFASLTEDDCQFIIQLVSEGDNQKTMERLMASNLEFREELGRCVLDAYKTIEQGGTPEKVDFLASAKNYRSRFDRYYDVVIDESVFDAMRGAMLGMGRLLNGDEKEKLVKDVESLMLYVKDNYRAIYFNVMIRQLTESELVSVMQFVSSEAGKHYYEGAKAALANKLKVSWLLFDKFVEYGVGTKE